MIEDHEKDMNDQDDDGLGCAKSIYNCFIFAAILWGIIFVFLWWWFYGDKI